VGSNCCGWVWWCLYYDAACWVHRLHAVPWCLPLEDRLVTAPPHARSGAAAPCPLPTPRPVPAACLYHCACAPALPLRACRATVLLLVSVLPLVAPCLHRCAATRIPCLLPLPSPFMLFILRQVRRCERVEIRTCVAPPRHLVATFLRACCRTVLLLCDDGRYRLVFALRLRVHAACCSLHNAAFCGARGRYGGLAGHSDSATASAATACRGGCPRCLLSRCSAAILLPYGACTARCGAGWDKPSAADIMTGGWGRAAPVPRCRIACVYLRLPPPAHCRHRYHRLAFSPFCGASGANAANCGAHRCCADARGHHCPLPSVPGQWFCDMP